MGDFIEGYDNTNKPQAIIDLQQIEAVYDNLIASRYYVLGNHDVEDTTKAEFATNTGLPAGPPYYYYADVGDDVRLVMLDACFLSDDDTDPYVPGSGWATSYIPPNERTWLQNTALDTDRIVICFTHQVLYNDNPPYEIDNAAAVRTILEAAGNVAHVFSGHRHDTEHVKLNGIWYHKMEAMTEDPYPANAYARVLVYRTGGVEVIGAGGQTSYTAGVVPP